MALHGGFYGSGCLCPLAGVGEENLQSGTLVTPVHLSQEPGLGCWVLGVFLEKVSTGNQVTVELTAVCSFPVLTETRFPPEFAQSLLSSSLNQLRQEVNDQQSLRDLVREENKGENL